MLELEEELSARYKRAMKSERDRFDLGFTSPQTKGFDPTGFTMHFRSRMTEALSSEAYVDISLRVLTELRAAAKGKKAAFLSSAIEWLSRPEALSELQQLADERQAELDFQDAMRDWKRHAAMCKVSGREPRPAPMRSQFVKPTAPPPPPVALFALGPIKTKVPLMSALTPPPRRHHAGTRAQTAAPHAPMSGKHKLPAPPSSLSASALKRARRLCVFVLVPLDRQ
jgi:hypothetical protein